MIKRWFKIKDENYNECFELGGKGGIYFKEDDCIDICLIDTAEIAQNAIENCDNIEYNEEFEMLFYHKKDIVNNIRNRLNLLMDMIEKESIEFALSCLEDDEECSID